MGVCINSNKNVGACACERVAKGLSRKGKGKGPVTANSKGVNVESCTRVGAGGMEASNICTVCSTPRDDEFRVCVCVGGG